jgi:hypothetical protein
VAASDLAAARLKDANVLVQHPARFTSLVIGPIACRAGKDPVPENALAGRQTRNSNWMEALRASELS